MKLNGILISIKFQPDIQNPPLYRFQTEVLGQCSKEQYENLKEVWISRGAVQIQEWSEFDPTFGYRIVLKSDEDAK